MNVVRKILLGTTASVVLVSVAQSADQGIVLKGKPAVQYVKVCDTYGAGFYYVPGTDTCVKIGSYVRFEVSQAPSSNASSYSLIGSATTSRPENSFGQRTRALSSFDTRTETELGTVRSFFTVGLNYDSPAGTSIYSNRAYMQWAGFTVGTAVSFYDFYGTFASSHYWYAFPTQDTYEGGWKVAAYTHQFGSGLSGTVSFEEPRRTDVINGSITSSTAWGALGNSPATDLVGIRYPDLVTNLRLDQSWGAAQIMGVLHDASGANYGTSAAGTEALGHPPDALGYVVGGGLKLNVPSLSPSDYFQLQGTYTEGALGYVFTSSKSGPFPSSQPFKYSSNNSVGFGWAADSVYNNGSKMELTKAWSINAQYEHYWTKQWHTSLYGVYAAVNFDDKANKTVCSAEVASGLLQSGPNCDSDYSRWAVGSRTEYIIVPGLTAGVDVIYEKLNTSNQGALTGTGLAANLGRPGGTSSGGAPGAVYKVADQDSVGVKFRFQRALLFGN